MNVCSRVAKRVLKPFPRVYSRYASEKAWAVIKPGNNILLDGVPYEVTKTTQGGRGRGASFVKSKLKNLVSGKGMDKTFRSDEDVDVPQLDKYTVEYSWEDSDEFVFMDTTTFDEYRVTKDMVPKAKFLLPGHILNIFKYQEKVIKVYHPATSVYNLVSVDPSERM